MYNTNQEAWQTDHGTFYVRQQPVYQRQKSSSGDSFWWLLLLFVVGVLTFILLFRLHSSRTHVIFVERVVSQSGVESVKVSELVARRRAPVDASSIIWPPPSSSPLGRYRSAAVAADHAECSAIGASILRKGGNAVDAAVAAALCTGVHASQSCGLGGGHFTTIYDRKSKRCYAIDARPAAPRSATTDMYADGKLSSSRGWSASAVPGEVHGLYTAFKEFGSGKIEWRQLVQPTIQLLANGQVVSPAMADSLSGNSDTIFSEPTMRIFINPETNEVYKAGERLFRPKLLETFRQLARSKDPIELFYRGSLTKNFAYEFEKYGGQLTKEDFANYKSIIRPTAIYADMPGGLTSCGPPPPSGAAVTQAILNIFSGFGVEPKRNLSTFDSNLDTFHRLIESMKFGYADRALLGDMDFVDGAFEWARNMTSTAYAKSVRSAITRRAHSLGYYGEARSTREDHGTAHLSVVDAQGNAVALTTSVNLSFGSKRRSPSTGIVWNNDMDDFTTPTFDTSTDFPPTPANFIAPGKRPQSSMSPIVVFDRRSGQVRLVTGGSGGSKIISETVYVAARALWFGESVKAAIDAPRLHNQFIPVETGYENGFPPEIVAGLERRGQRMTTSGSGDVMAIRREDDGSLTANSDHRKGITSATDGY